MAFRQQESSLEGGNGRCSSGGGRGGDGGGMIVTVDRGRWLKTVRTELALALVVARDVRVRRGGRKDGMRVCGEVVGSGGSTQHL